MLVPTFIKIFGKEKTLEHINNSYNRITSQKAKELAKPMYEIALELLNIHE